ncbi:hypothetical protein BDZ97DRAFT_1764130 [Flammula alnicola]|nr:hypothetical protein BDZ97DRAFT_1764130 [Flammula alnicola]
MTIRRRRRGGSSSSSTTAAAAHIRQRANPTLWTARNPPHISSCEASSTPTALACAMTTYHVTAATRQDYDMMTTVERSSSFSDTATATRWKQEQQHGRCCCSCTDAATRRRWQQQQQDDHCCCLYTTATRWTQQQQHDGGCCSYTATATRWKQQRQRPLQLLGYNDDKGERSGSTAVAARVRRRRDGSSTSSMTAAGAAPLWR